MSKVAYLEDEGIKVARDMVKGTTWIHRSFLDLVTGTEQTVWAVGGIYVYPNTANTLSIVSDSASDNVNGVGARTLTIEGLDANYDVISETVTMNDGIPVVTTKSYLRLYRATVLTAGSNETNVGNITVTHNGINNPLGRIASGSGQTQMSVYTIARGKTGYLSYVDLTSSKNTDGRATIRTRLNGVSRIRHSTFLFGGNYNFEYKYPTVLPEKTDIEVRAVALTGSGQVTGSYGILLVDNDPRPQ